ncbi:hypothetical protein R70723_09015 [Paenibacillus sp. FSL R7-0273]|uniref:DUF1292 domain-containing protein n=1 Tax=Paenibacillus sp. FSL R7-0273 TaxID=1536772 RepID=UPI0004F93438|nr:DUF1292 domain-containing protein [Paenibacillus sp. FSL R7-0273]AIQ46006.1 hypothetical protein R70723_09015 [Paenibacillus sp. FSL R7-0273]OMF92867.1 DUF1292 domain-containing protein [Paenibacillus sp. FSL R7-0273]
MTDFSAEQAVWTSKLKEAYGETVELEDEQGRSSVYNIVAEFEVGGRAYAVLAGSGKNAEKEILRIVVSPDGVPELESIVDDEEWEDISELYDELTFPADVTE